MDLEAFFQSGDVEGVFYFTHATPKDEIDVMQGEADIAAIENTIKELDDEMDVIHGEAAIENTIKELDVEMDAMHAEADITAIENTLKELDNEMVENDPEVLPELECLTEIDCKEQMSGGYEKFKVGDFPLAGCFAKDGILYWGTGETFNESMDLDAFFQGGGAVEGVFC